MSGARGTGWSFICGAFLALALILAPSDARASSTAAPAMVALGDSLTRAWGSGGAPIDNVGASWATGTDAGVQSHFQRLAPLQPGLTAANAAVSGSTMAATSTQADTAVSAGATYVTLLSGTNDVCAASTAAMTSVSNFTSQVRTTLTKLAAIPGTTIFVASIPDWYTLWDDHRTNPVAVSAWLSNSVCPTIFGAVTDAERQAARQRIDDFNAALASVCAEFTPCTYDGGATHGLRFATTELAFDFFHPSVSGQARLAQATWAVGPFALAPVSVSAPVVSGVAQVGQSLSASSGAWSGSPSGFAYQWRRCDAAGGGCVDVAGATSSSYQVASADLGFTLRVRVTASNSVGSTSADSTQTAVVTAASGGVPAGFTSVVTDAGCAGCSVSSIAAGLRATVAGAADTVDTAFAVMDFGGAGGVAGRVWVRDLLALASGQTLASNLAVLQLRDNGGALVYELYLASDRSLRLWSPAGGLRASSINLSTGVLVPNNGSSSIRVEVSALAGSSVVVRVDDIDRITLTGLNGATTGNQRYLRAGIDHYDGTSGLSVASDHTFVGTSQTTWLGAPGSPPASAPVSVSAPVVSGVAQVGQSLSASSGAWSGSPSGFAYQWRRCDAAGGGCVDVAGATSSSYQVASADLGFTLRVRVTASNSVGSTSADSTQTAVVTAAAGGVPAGFTSVVTDAGCAGCSVSSIADGLRATVAGAADTADTAFAVMDFGGAGGVPGRVWVRDVLRLVQGQTLTANVAVFQVRDNSDGLVYELYLASDRSLRLFSRAGGLRATSINLSTGMLVPNDGSSSLLVEVSALANSSVVVRVDGVDRISLSGLSGATTGNQRYLRAGIDHYDGASTQPVASEHRFVATSQATWLGAPGSPPATAPVSVSAPVVSGVAQVGQSLSASSGAWSGSPTGFAYQWRRCDAAGSACVDVAGATSSSYQVAAADLGFTLRARVTASNSVGSTSADSTQTATVTAASAATNLAPDPDFELSPTPWYFTNGAATFSWATDQSRSSTHSLKVASTNSSLVRWLSNTTQIAAQAGSAYTGSVYARTSGVSGSARLTLTFWNASAGYLGVAANSASLTGTQAWTPLTLTQAAPAGTAYVRVELRLNGPGTAWFDDLTLTRQ